MYSFVVASDVVLPFQYIRTYKHDAYQLVMYGLGIGEGLPLPCSLRPRKVLGVGNIQPCNKIDHKFIGGLIHCTQYCGVCREMAGRT